MRRCRDRIESRCGCPSSPRAAGPPGATSGPHVPGRTSRPPVPGRTPSAGVSLLDDHSKFEFHTVANCPRQSSIHFGTRCPLLRLDPVGHPPHCVSSVGNGLNPSGALRR